jgi:energy-coupling factor transporter transmembrane protein EcfT
MANTLPNELSARLAEAERAATPDRRPDWRDWLVLALSAVAAPVVILFFGWVAR